MERDKYLENPSPDELQARMKILVGFLPLNDNESYERKMREIEDRSSRSETGLSKEELDEILGPSDRVPGGTDEGRRKTQLYAWWGNQLSEIVKYSRLTNTGKVVLEEKMKTWFLEGKNEDDEPEIMEKALGINDEGFGIFQEEGVVDRELALFYVGDEVTDIMKDVSKRYGVDVSKFKFYPHITSLENDEGYLYFERRDKWKREILDKYEIEIQ